MSESSLRTTQLHGWLLRIRAGDQDARNELLRGVCGRLERLARKMLKGFPQVRRWAQTDDVLQSALMRLFRSLEEIEPASVRAFFGLAAEQMRRELLDLARHFYGPQGHGRHYAGAIGNADSQGPEQEPEAPTENSDPGDLWSAFHVEVEKLPAEERETVGLIFYHGWTQIQVAELFQVDERTVRRRWRSACTKLSAALGGNLPGI